MLSPAHSWLLIVGLTTLLLVIYLITERAVDRYVETEHPDDWDFDHADSDIGI